MLEWLRAILCNRRRKPLTPPLGYRKLNPHVRLKDGVKRARKRTYAVRKDVKNA